MLENYEIEIKAKREQEDKELAEARAQKGRGLRIIGFGMFLVILVAMLYIVFMLTTNKANVKPIVDGIVIEDVQKVKEKARRIFKPKSKVVRKPKRRVIKKVTPKKAKAAPSTDWRDTVFQSGD